MNLPDEYRVNALATYNGEVARGVVHTPEFVAFMESEQRWFGEVYMPAEWARMGYEPVPGEGMTVYRKIKGEPFWKRFWAGVR